MTVHASVFTQLETALTPTRLRLSGEWTLPYYALLEHELQRLRGKSTHIEPSTWTASPDGVPLAPL